MQLEVNLTPTATTVVLPDNQGQVIFTTKARPLDARELRLNVSDGHLAGFGDGEATEMVFISVPWTSEPAYVQRGLAGEAIPAAQVAYVDALKQILTRFGVALAAPAKKKPAKARHRFVKSLSTMPFHVTRNNSVATVYWTARNEMTIKAGAKLTAEKIMNKDGSPRYGTKYGDKLRDDHRDQITDFTTTEDIGLRSVNEVGLFLYYGDTNGWLELVNDSGQTLDELTRVD
ncbi:hypothetical protein [Lacticaseibacillus sp. GG6-2]